ncbi:hypothetical protein FRC08_001877 [Ceratobasidium sp. 394]|nr:hypothetical protein FRC08_001877 [Ceratobasidium sp. 394]
MDLLRHLPPRSPCFTTPFFIFTASTVLLLSPRDAQAMRAVRTGLSCLEAMEKEGVWVESVIDAKQRIWGLARRWEIGVLSPTEGPSWQHSTPTRAKEEEQDHGRGVNQAHAAAYQHNSPTVPYPSQISSPTSPTSYTPIHTANQSPTQNRSGSEPLSSTQDSPPLDLMAGSVPSYSPGQFEQFYLDSMPEPNVAIPWAGPIEPSLWMMGPTTGSSYQGSWDFLLSNPASMHAEAHRVLTPAEAEALMQELRRGNLEVGRHA